MKCPKCGANIDDGSKFCDECGSAIPQSKECPKCHARLKSNARFCSECGYSFSGKPAVGVAPMIGDKNVIAGDVSLTQTIVNQDETKKVVECCVCKRPVAITKAFVCSHCGGNVCKDHYDAEHQLCSSCLEEKSAAAEAEYRTLLAKVLADGIIEKSEFKELEALRTRLGLSQARAKELQNEMRSSRSQVEKEKRDDVLRAAELEKLEEAESLAFDDGKSREAVNVLSEVYADHPLNEKVLDFYLPALARFEPERAAEIISALDVDYKCAHLTSFDMCMRVGDLVAAEERLMRLEEMWPNDGMVRCRRTEYLCAVYIENGDSGKLYEAEDIAAGLNDCEDVMEMSWQYYVKHLVSQCLGDDIPDLRDNSGEYDGIYDAVATGAIGGYIDIGYIKIFEKAADPRFLSRPDVYLTLPQVRALQYLSRAGNPFAKVHLADCCVFGNGSKSFGNGSLYREALDILENFELEPGDDEQVKVKLGPYDFHAPVEFYYSYAAFRLAICFKKGIGLEKNSSWADVYWDDFKKSHRYVYEVLVEKYGEDLKGCPYKAGHFFEIRISDFDFENFEDRK